MIPSQEMIPKLDWKWSQTANNSRCGPQMILLENEEWLIYKQSLQMSVKSLWSAL